MSSSNLAVRMEHAASDLLSHPPRPELRVAANDEPTVRTRRLRISLTNRKFVARDPRVNYFRVR